MISNLTLEEALNQIETEERVILTLRDLQKKEKKITLVESVLPPHIPDDKPEHVVKSTFDLTHTAQSASIPASMVISDDKNQPVIHQVSHMEDIPISYKKNVSRSVIELESTLQPDIPTQNVLIQGSEEFINEKNKKN